jgi:hypothetical protein
VGFEYDDTRHCVNLPQNNRMRRAYLLFICCLATSLVHGQDLDQIADKTCTCITAKKLEGQSTKQIEMAFGLCMLEAVQQTGYEIDLSNPEATRQLGEKVGVKMASKCPSAFAGLTEQLAEMSSDEPETLSVHGKIKAVEVSDFVFVVVKETDSGKEGKYLWLRHFSGSDEFAGNPKKLVGKTVTLSYRNLECYVPKASGYFNQKEITDLKIE